MSVQAVAFGAAELSRAADVVNTSLTEMTGATSPRLHLELMVARLLVPASDDSERGALARVERLERRVGIADRTLAVSPRRPPPDAALSGDRRDTPRPRARPPSSRAPKRARATGSAAPAPAAAAPSSPPATPAAPVTLQQLRDAWPEILEVVQKAKRTAWMVVYTSTPRALNDDVLTLSFPSETDVSNFKERPTSGDSVSEQLRAAITAVLGIRVKFVARVDAPSAARRPRSRAVEPGAAEEPAAEAGNGGWNVTAIPGSEAAALAAAADTADEAAAEAPAEEPSAAGGATAPSRSAMRGLQPARRATARPSCASSSARTSSRSRTSPRATAR